MFIDIPNLLVIIVGVSAVVTLFCWYLWGWRAVDAEKICQKFSTQLNKTSKDYEQALLNIHDLTTSLDKAKSNLSHFQERGKRIELKLNQSQEELDLRANNSKNLEIDKENFISELKGLRDEVLELNIQQKKFEDNEKQLTKTIKNYRAESARFKSEAESFQKALQDAVQKEEEQKKIYNEKELEVQDLQNRTSQLSSDLKAFQSKEDLWAQKINTLMSEHNELQNEIEVTTDSLKKYEAQVLGALSNNQNLEQKIEALTLSLNQSNKEKVELKRRIEELQGERLIADTGNSHKKESKPPKKLPRNSSDIKTESNNDLKDEFTSLKKQYKSLHKKSDKDSDKHDEKKQKNQKKKLKDQERLERIKERSKLINFERIGHAKESEKDDLKLIHGIGPSIEKKLNILGIFTFAQISHFSQEDEDSVNKAIEFFPGRVHRDAWVKQAKKLNKQKV